MADKKVKISDAVEAELMTKLKGMKGISSKKMFGGYGLMHEERMFSFIDAKGNAFFKATGDDVDKFIAAGSEKHHRMPYYSIPEEVNADVKELKNWAKASIKATKK